MNQKVAIVQLDTGVPGLNEVLWRRSTRIFLQFGRGWSRGRKDDAGSTNLLCIGHSGASSAVHHCVRRAGPQLLRYQQQFAFFDQEKVNGHIRFVSIAHEILEGGLGKVLERIIAEVEATSPGFVVVDSFRSVIRAAQGSEVDQGGVAPGVRTATGSAADDLASDDIPGR